MFFFLFTLLITFLLLVEHNYSVSTQPQPHIYTHTHTNTLYAATQPSCEFLYCRWNDMLLCVVQILYTAHTLIEQATQMNYTVYVSGGAAVTET